MSSTSFLTVSFAAITFVMVLAWFPDVNVTLCNVSVTLSKKILDVHPRSDSAELAKAVPIVDLSCGLVINWLRPGSKLFSKDGNTMRTARLLLLCYGCSVSDDALRPSQKIFSHAGTYFLVEPADV